MKHIEILASELRDGDAVRVGFGSGYAYLLVADAVEVGGLIRVTVYDRLEAAAIDREHVRLHDGLIDLGPVVERDGTIRSYPKSPAGERTVPVPDHLWPRVRERALAVPPGELLFPAPEGGVLGYSHWYHRAWAPALRGRPERLAVRGRAYRPEVAGADLADPQPTPHDLRHSYGTRLAEQGVPPHEIMVLMGHESLESVQRYIHAGEERFDRARKAVARSRRHSGRASSGRQERPASSHIQPSPTINKGRPIPRS